MNEMKLSNLKRSLMHFLFPRDAKCVLCGRPAIGRSCICADCLQKLPPVPANTRSVPGVTRLVSAYEYQEPLRTLMHTFKYDNQRYVARFFALAMARMDDFPKDCVLCGVPLHEQRLKERGFCQTDELCRELSELTGRQWVRSALTRIRYTPSQTHLSYEERIHNLDDAFFAKGIKGLHVILVDDVVTTGSTLRECALTLRAAGAAEVYALTACQAMEKEG